MDLINLFELFDTISATDNIITINNINYDIEKIISKFTVLPSLFEGNIKIPYDIKITNIKIFTLDTRGFVIVASYRNTNFKIVGIISLNNEITFNWYASTHSITKTTQLYNGFYIIDKNTLYKFTVDDIKYKFKVISAESIKTDKILLGPFSGDIIFLDHIHSRNIILANLGKYVLEMSDKSIILNEFDNYFSPNPSEIIKVSDIITKSPIFQIIINNNIIDVYIQVNIDIAKIIILRIANDELLDIIEYEMPAEDTQLIAASKYGFIIGLRLNKNSKFINSIDLNKSNIINDYIFYLMIRTDIFDTPNDIIEIGKGNDANLNDDYLHHIILESYIKEFIPILPLINIIEEY